MTKKPLVIIHGGAGRLESDHPDYRSYRIALKRIALSAFDILRIGDARECALHAIRSLEDCEIFNAGKGSKIQSDGVIRMTASIIDSQNKIFSGVVNIENVEHPIDVANILNKDTHSVLSGALATKYAWEQGFSFFDPRTDERQQEFIRKVQRKFGTVGVVAVDKKGCICSATSTGGIGDELPGRMSDSATVAGTYANRFAGVSCTGIGEQIVNAAVAAKLATMVEMGVSLEKSTLRIINQANKNSARFGFISLDKNGSFSVGQTRGVKTMYALYDGNLLKVFQ